MRRERAVGFTCSGVLHVLLGLLILMGLPSLLPDRPLPEPSAISVEILPITGVTNVKPSEVKPTPKQEEEKKPEAKKPTPPVKTAEPPPPPPPKPEEKPEPKKPEKVEEKKPEPKKPEKPKEDDLLAVLKSVKETAAKQQADTPKKQDDSEESSTSKSKSQQYDPSMPLSMSEKDAIRSQISRCWSVPAGARDAHGLVVVLRVEVQRDGSVLNVALAEASKGRYAKDTFFRAAADSAMRAVRMCSPLKDLPPEKYDTWRDMELTFDPKEMLF